MIRKYVGVFAVLISAAALLSLGSCARGTSLTGISIQANSGTFGGVDPSLQIQFRAFGTYIHPPKTVDITDQVDWQTNIAQVAQVTSAGVV